MWRHYLGLAVLLCSLAITPFVPTSLLSTTASLARWEMPASRRLRYEETFTPIYKIHLRTILQSAHSRQQSSGSQGMVGISGSINRVMGGPNRLFDRMSMTYVYTWYWIWLVRIFSIIYGWSFALLASIVAFAVALYLHVKDTNYRFQIDTNPSLTDTQTDQPWGALSGWFALSALVAPLPIPLLLVFIVLFGSLYFIWAGTGWQRIA